MSVLKNISVSTVVWVLLAAWFSRGFYTLYVNWNPAECTSGECITPMFQPDELVDTYVYTSTSQKPVTTTKKFESLDLIYNTTGHRFDAEIEVNFTIALPESVRKNGSLYTHVFMVKQGGNPNPLKHKKTRTVHSFYDEMSMYQPYSDLVYVRGSLTRHQVPIAKNFTMLLGGEALKDDNDNDNDNNNDNNNGGGGSSGEVNLTDASVEDSELQERPFQMLFLYSVAFGVTAAFPANIGTAALRYGIVAMFFAVLPSIKDDIEKAFLSEDGSVQDLLTSPNTPPTTHWKGRLNLNVVQDFAKYEFQQNGWPPFLFVEWHEKQGQLVNKFYKMFGGNGQPMQYLPEVYVDDWSLMTKYFRPVSTNMSATDPTLFLRINPVGKTKFQIMKQFASTTRVITTMGFSERDMDDVKQLITETSLYMLGLTYIISFMHMFFDYLAFKNDVGFFKDRKDYTGISGRTLLSNFVCSLVIVLYLMDNEYTSRIVLGSVFVSTMIEGWKVTKVMKPTCVWSWGLPWIGRAVSATKSKGEEETSEIDVQGFKWLQLALYPMVMGWAIYSLLTEAHKSWWSWCIHSCAHGVYTFGFVLMTPQLFINYKLKSVAHLPWKVLMYKAFNTFIDDVFSFIVVMPTSHRIACLRDDLVFFIFLYQKWCYPVDMKRANEFGIAYEEDEDDDKLTQQQGLEQAMGKANANDTTNNKESTHGKMDSKSTTKVASIRKRTKATT